MAEELNVGSIVAEIRLKTEQLEAGAEKAVAAIKEIGRKGEETVSKISGIGKSINTSGAVSSFNSINKAMSDTTVDKYTDKMLKLTSQLEVQRANTDKLSAEIDSLSAGLKNLEGFDIEKVFPKEIAAEEESLQKERELEAQIKAVITAREKAAQTAVSTASKTVTAQENVVTTQKNVTKSAGGANMALDTGATALRAVTTAAGGSVSQLGYLGTELMYLKRSMQAAQTAGAAFATFLSFGLMAAVTLISMGIQQLQEKEEKRQQAFDDGVSNLKKYSEELQTLNRNIDVLKDNASTTEQLTTARNNLTSTFDDLLIGYTDEGTAILATNEQLEKQIEHLKEIAGYNRQDVIETGKTGFDNLRHYQSTYQEYNGTRTSIDGESRLQVLTDEFNEANKINQADIKSMENWLWERTGDYGKQYDNILETFTTVKNGIGASIDEIQKKLKDSYSSSKDLIDKAPDYVKAVLEDSLVSVGKAAEDLSNKERAVFNNLFLGIVDDVVNGSVSIDEAQKRILDTMSDTDKIDAAYTTLITSTENASIAAEQLEETYKNVSSAASSALGEMSSAQSDLAGAFAELSENGALAQSTINSLLAKYPELIDYIDSGNGSLAVNADTLKAIYEIQKQAQIAELEAAKAKLAANDSVIQSNINRAQSEIEVWKAELRSTGGDSFSARMLSEAEANLKSYTDEYEKSVSRIDKIIDYLNKSQLDLTGTSAGDAADEYSDALNEQYKQIENLKALKQLSAKGELDWLERIRKTYKMNADERTALEIRIYNLKQELVQNEIDALDNLGDAVTEALKNQYEKQREYEETRIKSSIEGWNDWEKRTVSSIQAQIDALDDLQKQQESQSAADEYYRKSQELKLNITYEKDDYQREQYQKELNRLTEAENERLEAERIAEQKAQLQTQIDNTKSIADARREALEAELDVISENYDALTSELSLRAQAEKTIMESSQAEIVKLIKSYAPEYKLAGQTIGEQLYNGMKSKVDNIASYMEGVIKSISAYQKKLASVAAKAADDFELSYKNSSPASSSVTSKTVNYTSNFYQPIESPVDTKRAILSTSDSLARLIQ